MLNAVNSGAVASSKAIHSGFDSAGLLRRSFGLVVSNDRVARNRDVAASGASEKNRSRQALEQLFGLIAPDGEALAIAETLLDRFGSIAAVLEASTHRSVIAASDTSGRLLAAVQRIIEELSRTGVETLPDFSSAAAVCKYLGATMGAAPVEQVRVLFLSGSNRLLNDEVISRGSVSGAHICCREIIRIALLCNATGLILAHNHPSGDARPSAEDVAVTQVLISRANDLGITVHDHLIVAGKRWLSMRGEGLIQ